MKVVLEKSWEFNSKSYTAFLDLEKVFHRVPRDKLWQAMWKVEYDNPPMLLKAITGMYRKCSSSIRTAHGLSLWFEVKTEVRQGMCISPLLFVLLIDQVMKQAKVELQEVERGEMALNFAYADDIGW